MGQVLIELEPVEAKVGNSVVRLVKDDVTAMEVEAFVYYAREDLVLDAGYGTAIGQRGGQSIKTELDEIGGNKRGEAVILMPPISSSSFLGAFCVFLRAFFSATIFCTSMIRSNR